MHLSVLGGTDVHGRPVEVHVTDGLVSPTAAAGAGVLPANGLLVAPGLLDLQVNGAGGVDVTATPDRLGEVGRELVRHGVTAWLPTVVTSRAETRLAASAALAAAHARPDPGAAAPLGLHLEGPLLAEARKGAHSARWLRTPGTAEEVAPPGTVLVTLAPELPGAVPLVAQLAADGVVVSLGHSEATAEQALAAVDAGARTVTHLFNAMSGVAGRVPGLAGVALGDPRLVVGVIADGHHLDPHVLRLAWQALGPERFWAVSDTTAALGVGDGPNRLGELEVTVADGAVRLADGTLAGSASSLADCLGVLRATTGCSTAEAVGAATTVPARILGDTSRGHLRPGARGDLALLDPATLQCVATVVAGRVVHDARESRR